VAAMSCSAAAPSGIWTLTVMQIRSIFMYVLVISQAFDSPFLQYMLLSERIN